MTRPLTNEERAKYERAARYCETGDDRGLTHEDRSFANETANRCIPIIPSPWKDITYYYLQAARILRECLRKGEAL